MLGIFARTAAEIDVIGDRVPSVVDSDKEEQKASGGDSKQGVRKVVKRCVCRDRERDVSGEGERSVEHPIFQLGLVQGLRPHAAHNDDLVSESDDANKVPENRRKENSVPRRPSNRG